MATGNVEIAFLGDSSGLVGAINNSLTAMNRMEVQSKSFGASIANSAIKTLAPVAAAIGAAFASQKALQAFAASDLPGAKAFAKQMNATKASIVTLSESVGEFLAPAAQRVAAIVQAIAEKLEPIVRKVTAFSSSATDFLLKLGQNIWDVFLNLVPSVAAIVDQIKNYFSTATDWESIFQSIRQKWNEAWSGVVDFLAPIMAASFELIDAVVGGITQLVKLVGNSLPAATGSALPAIGGIVDAIQGALLTSISFVTTAIKNWQLSFDIAVAAARFAVSTVQDYFGSFAVYAKNLFAVIGDNLYTIFEHYALELEPVFETLAKNIGTIFSAVFDAITAGIKNTAIKAAIIATNPLKFGLDNSGLKFKGLNDALPSFIAPKIGPLKSLPEVQGLDPLGLAELPGKSATKSSADTLKLLASLDTLRAQFPDLGPEIAAAIASAPGIKDALAKGLPDVTAKPLDRIGSQSQIEALQYGTAAAFKAERAGTSPELDEAKKQTELLRQTVANTGNKPKPPRVVGFHGGGGGF